MLFKPTVAIKSVLDIDKAFLDKYEIKALILDLDNTLSLHGSPAAENGIFEWLDDMRKLEIPMIIVSNNTNRRVTPLAKDLGLDFFANGWKPLTFGMTRAVRKLGLPAKEIAMVGDQLFTDVLGGNIKGLKTVLVEPFHIEKGLLFVIKRGFERLFFKREYKNK